MTQFQVKNLVLPNLFYIYYVFQHFYSVGTAISALQVDGSQWSTAASVQRASLSL